MLLFNRLAYFPASADQSEYLPKLLSNTERIVIRNSLKAGGEMIASISDPKEVGQFVNATRITRFEDPCACVGMVDVEFISNTGETNSLNYNRTDSYIKFKNPWGLQAKAPKEFMKLVATHAKD